MKMHSNEIELIYYKIYRSDYNKKKLSSPSIHPLYDGQLWSDFEKVSLKMSGKA
jgi:hypothetical protein